MAYSVPLETLPPLVKEFASYKSVIQNASEKTISEYLLDLRTFFRFLIARDKKISPDSEEFEKIDIRGIDLEYIKTYAFLMVKIALMPQPLSRNKFYKQSSLNLAFL